jgi:hypothetical protein
MAKEATAQVILKRYTLERPPTACKLEYIAASRFEHALDLQGRSAVPAIQDVHIMHTTVVVTKPNLSTGIQCQAHISVLRNPSP